MTVTPEDIAAFADGELSDEREEEIAAAVAADPDLARQVDQHKAFKAMLAEHYAPVLDQPVPDRLTAMLVQPQQADVADFAAARERREMRRPLPHWGWMAGPALAASLVLALFLASTNDEAEVYADKQLAAVLEDTLVASQLPAEETRVLLSFRTEQGQYCRVFSGGAGGGIACRDDEGWRLEVLEEGSEGVTTDYRMAGAGDGEILALAQEMASGTALDADGERAARAQGWR